MADNKKKDLKNVRLNEASEEDSLEVKSRDDEAVHDMPGVNESRLMEKMSRGAEEEMASDFQNLKKLDGQRMFNLDINDGIKSEKPSNVYDDLAIPRMTASLSKKAKEEESFKLDIKE